MINPVYTLKRVNELVSYLTSSYVNLSFAKLCSLDKSFEMYKISGKTEIYKFPSHIVWNFFTTCFSKELNVKRISCLDELELREEDWKENQNSHLLKEVFKYQKDIEDELDYD